MAELESEPEATSTESGSPSGWCTPAIANEPDRDTARRLHEARDELREEHLNPVLLEAATAHRDAVPRARRRRLRRPLRAPRVRPRAARRRSAARCSTRPSGRGSSVPTGSSASAIGRRAGRGRRRGTCRACFRAPELGRGVPRRPDAARARGDARRPRHRPARRRRTSISTSSRARTSRRARSVRRSRCRAASCSSSSRSAASTTGDALFHEAGHTEHYANTEAGRTRRGEAMGDSGRDRGLGLALRAGSSASRPGSIARLDVGAAARVRGGERRARPLLRRAATRPSSSTSSSSTGPRTSPRCATATSSSSATR